MAGRRRRAEIAPISCAALSVHHLDYLYKPDAPLTLKSPTGDVGHATSTTIFHTFPHTCAVHSLSSPCPSLIGPGCSLTSRSLSSPCPSLHPWQIKGGRPVMQSCIWPPPSSQIVCTAMHLIQLLVSINEGKKLTTSRGRTTR